MRPLPRVHAFTNGPVLALDDLGVRAAALAAAGPALALHVRDRAAGGRRLTDVTRRFLSLAGPPEAAVLVNGHPDIAQGCAAQGVQLGQRDLLPADARRIYPRGWIGCSVHDDREAESAVENGADFLVAGTIFPSPSHPDQPAAGTDLIRRVSRFGAPVIAIGGITLARLPEIRDAGAYGVAAISALWFRPDPAAAALELLEPWTGAS